MLFLVAKLEVFREITRNYGNNSLISFREIHSRLLQQFKSFFHTVTQIINHSEIFVHIPQVTGDQGFELRLDQRKSSLKLFLVILCSHRLAQFDQFIQHLGRNLKVLIETVKVLILLQPFCPMTVNQLLPYPAEPDNSLCNGLYQAEQNNPA